MVHTQLLEYLKQLPQESFTEDQREALETFQNYLAEPSPYSLFLLKGYAGTGKTYLMKSITEAARHLRYRLVLMASTGRAAKVLANTTGLPASTIHRTIYRSSAQLQEEGGTYEIARMTSQEPTIFIVDEASMISGESSEPTPFGSGNLLEDLLSFVWSGEDSKLIIIGDTAQLPPVGTEISDALNEELLSERYGMQVYSYELTQVVRQRPGGILHNATQLRELLEEFPDAEEGEELPIHLETEDWRGIFRVEPGEFLELLEDAYNSYGIDDCLVICPSNKRALDCNMAIRTHVLYYDMEDLVARGERLIVSRNSYSYTKRKDHSDFIANGEIIEVRSIYGHYHMYGLDFADVSVYLPDRDEEMDVRLLLSSLRDPAAQRSYEQRRALYEALSAEYAHIASITARRNAVRKDPSWGALEVKYGYAVTAHKAQGGQWACTFIDLGMVGYLPLDRSMARWIYTALTRAKKRAYLMSFPDDLVD